MKSSLNHRHRKPRKPNKRTQIIHLPRRNLKLTTAMNNKQSKKHTQQKKTQTHQYPNTPNQIYPHGTFHHPKFIPFSDLDPIHTDQIRSSAPQNRMRIEKEAAPPLPLQDPRDATPSIPPSPPGSPTVDDDCTRSNHERDPAQDQIRSALGRESANTQHI